MKRHNEQRLSQGNSMCQGPGVKESKECPVDGRALPSSEELGCYSKAYQQRNDLFLGGARWVGVALSRS